MKHRRTCLVFAALVLVSPLGARAQSPTSSLEQQAREKFVLAKEALKQGDTKGALALFRESWALQQRVSALLNMAYCEEQLGLVGSAARHYEEAIALLPETDSRRADANERLSSLAPRVPTLSVQLDEKVPKDATVLLDGQPMSASTRDTGVRLDPGAHTVEVSAPGRVTKTQRLTLDEATQRTLVVSLERPPSPQPSAGPTSVPRPVPIQTASLSRQLRVGAFVTLGTAGVSAWIGAIAGALAYQRAQELKQACPDHARCAPEYQPLQTRARAAGDASTAAFLFAGVALAGGGTLWLLSTRVAKSAPKMGVGLGPSSISLEGVF